MLFLYVNFDNTNTRNTEIHFTCPIILTQTEKAQHNLVVIMFQINLRDLDLETEQHTLARDSEYSQAECTEFGENAVQ